uniref:General transcriptional corepressor CYC8 n=1 Tax=Rhizophora mucronata TaxID=61149 RepID=A0A2P2NMJ1_RHIMU
MLTGQRSNWTETKAPTHHRLEPDRCPLSQFHGPREPSQSRQGRNGSRRRWIKASRHHRTRLMMILLSLSRCVSPSESDVWGLFPPAPIQADYDDGNAAVADRPPRVGLVIIAMMLLL